MNNYMPTLPIARELADKLGLPWPEYDTDSTLYMLTMISALVDRIEALEEKANENK